MIVVAGDVFSPRSTLGYPLQHTHGSMSSRSCIMLYAFTLSDCPMLSMRIYLAHLLIRMYPYPRSFPRSPCRLSH